MWTRQHCCGKSQLGICIAAPAVHSLQLAGTGVPGQPNMLAKLKQDAFAVTTLLRGSSGPATMSAGQIIPILPTWNNPEPCVFCSCNDTKRPWTDFREGALWQHQLTTLDDGGRRPAPHPLWQSWGLAGLTIFHICIDELHNGALGVLKHSLGSCIWACVHFANIPESFKTRVNMVLEVHL